MRTLYRQGDVRIVEIRRCQPNPPVGLPERWTEYVVRHVNLEHSRHATYQHARAAAAAMEGTNA